MSRVDAFIDDLAKVRFPNTFNPYSEKCPTHDKPSAPSIRRENLRLVLEAALANGAQSVWVGRDLGHLGGRRTGIALIDELRLPLLGKRMGIQGLVKATRTEAAREATASNVWHMVDGLEEVPVFWNAFPLHPHKPGIPASNRNHRSSELAATQHFLDDLLKMIRPSKIIALGNDAHRILTHLGREATLVRHPSFGGQTKFRDGIYQAYK